MSHFEEVVHQVDHAVADSVIVEMNTLLIALSDDAQLTREQRYQQQQRLRIAIAHKGHHVTDDTDVRRNQLTRGGIVS